MSHRSVRRATLLALSGAAAMTAALPFAASAAELTRDADAWAPRAAAGESNHVVVVSEEPGVPRLSDDVAIDLSAVGEACEHAYGDVAIAECPLVGGLSIDTADGEDRVSVMYAFPLGQRIVRRRRGERHALRAGQHRRRDR